MPEASVRADGPGVRRLRQERGWTQEQLAQKVGCVKKTIENAEAGKPLLVRTLHEIAEVFGVAPRCLEESRPTAADAKWSKTPEVAGEHGGGAIGSPQPGRLDDRGLAGQHGPLEAVQRRSLLFAYQVGALKAVLALVYRCRNTARSLVESPEDIARTPGQERLQLLRTLHPDLADLLYEERALLPDDVFAVAHRLKQELLAFFTEIDQCRRFRKKGQDDHAAEQLKVVKDVYLRLDQHYMQLVALVHGQIRSDAM